jgi:hypothetical protein
MLISKEDEWNFLDSSTMFDKVRLAGLPLFGKPGKPTKFMEYVNFDFLNDKPGF